MKLSTYCEAIKKTKIGNQVQRLEIEVDYDPEEDTIDEILEVNLYVNGIFKGEISDLLDKCEGCPLNTIIEAFDWREIYRGQKIKEAC